MPRMQSVRKSNGKTRRVTAALGVELAMEAFGAAAACEDGGESEGADDEHYTCTGEPPAGTRGKRNPGANGAVLGEGK